MARARKAGPGRTSPPGACRCAAVARGHGLRLDHCGPTLDQAVSQAARRRLPRSARASRRTASNASAMAASVITTASTSLVRADEPVPATRAPARPPRPTLSRPVMAGACRSSGRPDPVARRGRRSGHGDPRVVSPVSRVEGGDRPGDQEDAEQPDPDPGLGPVGGPAQRIAVQPERTSQPREATRPARPGFHGLTAAQPLMQGVASRQGRISEVLADLNMTNNPYSGCTNTTAPELAVAGQDPMAIGLLVSALDRLPRRGRHNGSRAGEHTSSGGN